MGNSILKTIISYLLIASIFISGNGVADVGFTFYWYYIIYIPFVAYCALVYRRIDIRIVYAILILAMYSLFTYQYGLHLVFKQIIGISFTLYVFYNFFLFENFNLNEVIRKYVTFSKCVLIIGFFQVLLFLSNSVNIDGGDFFLYIFRFLRNSNISFRFQSVAQEPSYLAYVFSPVVFLSLRNLVSKSSLLINRYWSFLFLLAFLLTFSLVAYVGLFLMMVIISFREITIRKLLISLTLFLCVGLICLLAYRNMFIVRMKIDETRTGFSEDITKNKKYENYNSSTYAFLTNLYITKDSFSERPFTGTGLGTYELTYDRVLPKEIRDYFELNRRDANSMGFRLLSETGLVGFLLFCFFLYKYRIKSTINHSPQMEFLWVINSGILLMMTLLLIRNGDYMSCGRILFLLLYFYTYQMAKVEKHNYATDAH